MMRKCLQEASCLQKCHDACHCPGQRGCCVPLGLPCPQLLCSISCCDQLYTFICRNPFFPCAFLCIKEEGDCFTNLIVQDMICNQHGGCYCKTGKVSKRCYNDGLWVCYQGCSNACLPDFLPLWDQRLLLRPRALLYISMLRKRPLRSLLSLLCLFDPATFGSGSLEEYAGPTEFCR